MTDLKKLKKPELEALCDERKISRQGKKDELIARIEEYDANQNSKDASKEDEIDWDDDADAAKPAAPPASTEATTASSASKPVAVMTTANPKAPDASAATKKAPIIEESAAASEAPATKEPDTEATGETAAADAQESKPEMDFSIGLEVATIDDEIAKRKARAEKYFKGQKLDPLAEEAIAKLERAKKFDGKSGPLGLNEALPDRKPKRRRDDDNDGGRGGFKRRGRGGRRFGGRDGPRRQGGTGQGNNKPTTGFQLSDKDRAAAEARKERFKN